MHQHTKILLNFYKKLCYCRGTARHTCQYKFCNYKTSHLKTRVPGLSCSIICVILRLAVLIQYRSVTDTHTHPQRERERERERETETDTRRRHIPRLAQRRAVKIDILHGPQSIITRKRASVDSKLLGRPRKVFTITYLMIMLKLHLIDSLSVCYTSKLATNTVTNRTDGVYA